MPASIGGAGIGTGGTLHFSGGSGAMSTVIRVAVVLKGLLRIGRLILRTRLGRQGLLRRNLITVFFTVNNPREKFSHPHRPRWRLHGRHTTPATTAEAPHAHVSRNSGNAIIEQKTLEISTLLESVHVRRDTTQASPVTIATAANASTTAPQQGIKSFHIRARQRRVETRICAKLRMPFHAVRLPADAVPRVRSEPVVMSPVRPPKQKRPPEGGRVRTRKR